MSNLEEDDVALKILHTADWHLGKPFASFDESDRMKLNRARLEVVDTILDTAERNQVQAVLCAGDLFDVPQPDAIWWNGLAEKFHRRKWTDRPIVLLPGNHDPVTDTSVYHSSHPFRAALPSWVHVVDSDDFELILGDNAILVARPCRRQSGQDDNALLLPVRQEGDTRIRIGMVHGSTFDMPEYQTNFPLDKDAAVQRGLNYLAIGDTHAWKEYPPSSAPTVYPSTPEQTSFGEKDTGNVALVIFFRHGRSPKIQRIGVARWQWQSQTIESLEDLRALKRTPNLQQMVLKLKLKVRATPEEYEEMNHILRDFKGTLAKHGEVGVFLLDREEMELDTRNIEQVFASQPSVIQSTARLLKEEEAKSPEVAQKALFHLYELCRQKQDTQ